MDQNEKFLTVDEIEEIYGISRRRLIRYIKEGKLKGIKKPGKTHVIAVSEIESFIEKQKPNSNLK